MRSLHFACFVMKASLLNIFTTKYFMMEISLKILFLQLVKGLQKSESLFIKKVLMFNNQSVFMCIITKSP